jgi:hypothetical protein
MSDSGSLWANMLGLGPMLGAIQDPGFQAHIKAIVEAITATNARCERLERKIDYLISISDQHDGRRPVVPVPVELGSVGDRGRAVTGGAPDDGNSRVTRPRAGAGNR